MAKKFPNSTFVPPKHGTGLRLVLAEAPGEQEAAQGIPLVGGSGRWFDGLCRRAGIKRDAITIANCLSCRPPNNVFPTDPDARRYISKKDGQAAVDQCYKNHVLPLLKGRPWTRIDLLGDKALRIVGKLQGGIKRWRGSPIPIPDIDPKKPLAVATLHPAYIARDQSMMPVVVNDLKKNIVPPPENYILFPSIEQVRAFVDSTTDFCFDIETNPKDGYKTITMVGISKNPYQAMCVPFRGLYKDELKKLFAKANSVIGWNCTQFDLPKLKEFDVVISEDCAILDGMLAQHLLQPDLPHALEFVNSLFTQKPAWKAKKGESEELYCCRDVDVTLQIWKQLKPMLRMEKLEDLYHDVQVPLAKICKLMQDTGFKLDPSRIKGVREKLLKEIDELEGALPTHMRTYDKPINKRLPAPPGTLSEKTGKPVKFITVRASAKVTPWRSQKQVEKFLYEELKLPVQRHIKTGRVTTDKQALERLFRKTQNPALNAIRKLRKLDELLSNFVKQELVKTDRVHASFNVHGTSTGRLSSSGPNLQNQPEAARYIYVPSQPGWKIISVDFSGIENRLTAYFADDQERLARFIQDKNFNEHKFAASLAFGIPIEEVVKDNDKDAPYGRAKRIVHIVDGGGGARKIAKLYDIPEKEVKEFMVKWKAVIPKTVQWQDFISKEARREGFLTNSFGRKRWIYTSSWFTESIRTPAQSTAADIIFRCMISLLHERIGWPAERVRKVVQVVESLPEPAKLLIQVHDELVLEAPEEMVDEVVDVLTHVMTQPWRELGGMSIPIGVAVGDSWAEVKKYEPLLVAA